MFHQRALRVGKLLERSGARHLFPRWLNGRYWKVATGGRLHHVYGSLMYLPPDQRQREILLDRYEPPVAGKMREVLKPGMSFCDVGANIGVFTLLAAKLVGDGGRVIAFEPIHDNARILRSTIELNGYKQVRLHEKAITESLGTAKLYLSCFRGSHSMLPNPPRFTGDICEVEAVRLDSLSELGNIDLMKVDVEGVEIQVLRSLGSCRPRNLIVEYSAEREGAAGFSKEEFVRVLRDLGYTSIVSLDAPNSVVEQSGEGNFFCSELVC